MKPLTKRERPKELQSKTTRQKTGCGNLYVTVCYDEQGRPFEVFATLGRAGGCAASQNEALTRAITLGLRCGVAPEEYVKELVDIRCPSPIMFPEEERILSCADAIAKVLSEA